jgi:hypothetical protein
VTSRAGCEVEGQEDCSTAVVGDRREAGRGRRTIVINSGSARILVDSKGSIRDPPGQKNHAGITGLIPVLSDVYRD